MATSAGVGLSTATDAAGAARAAARAALAQAEIESADWALVFATSAHRPHYGALLGEAQRVLGTEKITGCSAWGVAASGEEIEGTPGVAVLAARSSSLAAETLLVPVAEDQPEQTALEIARRVKGKGPGLLLLFPDPFAARLDLILESLGRMVPGLETIGGAASADPSADRTFQFYGRNVANRSVAGLHLTGPLRRTVGITQGCLPLGPPCRVTRGEGNVIFELDHRPALEVLLSRIPAPLRDSLDRVGAHLFFGFPPDPSQEAIRPGEYLVRGLVGADAARGALLAGAPVREGMPLLLTVREAHAAREDLKEMLRRVGDDGAGGPYRLGFYFNCAARGRTLHGVAGVDTAYISGAFRDVPLAGFFGNAEIAPLRGQNRLFTHTGVLTLIAEAGGA